MRPEARPEMYVTASDCDWMDEKQRGRLLGRADAAFFGAGTAEDSIDEEDRSQYGAGRSPGDTRPDRVP